MGLPADFEARKAFLQFADADAQVLRRLRSKLNRARSRFIDRFYEHLLAFPDTQALITDPTTLERLKQSQAAYFDRLFDGDYGEAYGSDRLRVGVAHHRVGLEPKWYLGAYALYLRLLLPEIWRAAKSDWGQALPAIEAVLKVVFFDIGLAVDTYRTADHWQAEASFRGLIEGSPDAIFVHREGRLVYVNPAMLAYLGYERPDDLLGKPVLDIIHREDHELVAARLTAMVETREPARPCEERLLRRDGSMAFAEVVAIPITFEGERAFAAVARDVTDRRQLTARLMQMDRMIAVGTLATGVGHEINNPLTYVVANVDFAVQQLPELSSELRQLRSLPMAAATPEAHRIAEDVERRLADLRQALEEAREGGDRVRRIVRDLRTFARAEQEGRATVRVPHVLESAINMTWNEIRHRARLVKQYETTPAVLADEARLGQVFLNLLVNAAHAIPEGHAEENEIRVRAWAQDGSVFVEIRDSGAGIAPDHLPHIFDPFFTTKPVGEGTGLGLAICHGIVTGLGGEIQVESEVGKGSTFRVVLPVADTVEAVRPSTPVASPVAGHRGRVLIVDDELLVANILKRFLSPDHDVVSVTTGRAALDLLNRDEKFDVILCDLMMPELSGMELYEDVVQSFPDQAERMIFLTGGAFTVRAREFLERIPNPRLEKPIEAQILRVLVRQLVG